MARPIRMALALMTVAVCATCSPLLPGDERAIPHTRGFQSDSLFHFTISPDDRWLIYFEQLTPVQVGTRDNEYGTLRALDLKNGTVREVTIAVDQGARRANSRGRFMGS